MIKKSTSCIRISDSLICPNCKIKNLIKNGFTKNKKQQFYCKNCHKRWIDFYCYKAYKLTTNAKKIPNPIFYKNKSYEVDEMRCYLKRKEKPIWIVYALERKTKRVVSFSLGRKTKRTIQYVTNSLALASPKSTYTDELSHYRSLIVKALHKVNRFGINVIERNNLSMRTHLKRLQRKTICFSGSFILLQCVLRIYFWVEKLYSSQEYFL